MTGEEVLAVGHLRQGGKPSMTAMLTGTALIGMMKPRAGKALPRHFVLGVTPSRRSVEQRARRSRPDAASVQAQCLHVR